MRIFSTGLAAFLGLALAGTASAQLPSTKGVSTPKDNPGIQQKLGNLPAFLGPGGSDDCSSPHAIAGTGSFNFDLTSATTGTQGQTELACDSFGTTGIGSDVWFAWTASGNGVASVTTCGNTLVDTKIAAYAGTACPTPGSAITCNDDACGLQSTITFPVTSGATYLLQVGTFPGAATGSGTMDITISNTPANDDCATPTVVVGLGPHPFDNLLATQGIQGQGEGLCNAFGTTGIGNDVWFSWTAPQTSVMTLTTCGQTGVDTKVAVYSGGGCPVGGALACNDDACGLQSSLAFPAVAGTTYSIQLGTFPGAAGGTGTFTLTPAATNDDCTAPEVIAGVGSFSFNLTGMTTGTEGQVEANCNAFGTTGIGTDVWFAWTAPSSGLATVATCGVSFDTKIAAYAGSGCPTNGTSLACNDDFCGLQSSMDFAVTGGSTYMLQIGTFPGAAGGAGNFTIDILGPPGPGTAFCAGDGSGPVACPCGNSGAPGHGCENGSGTGGALLSAAGSSSSSAGDVVFTATDSTPNSFGLFFEGTDAVNNGNGLAFGDGLRCVGGNIVRLQVVPADSGGSAATTVMIPGAPGQIRNYQWWYREPVITICGSGFNLSNAYGIAWTP